MLALKHFLFSLLFFLTTATAQNKVDSLLQVLSQEKIDLNKVKLYFQLDSYYKNSKPDSSIFYLNTALFLSKKIKHQSNTAKCFNKLGNRYKTKSEYDKALKHHEKADSLYTNIDDKEGKAIALGNIGLIYKAKGNYNKALAYYNEALTINEENSYTKGEADMHVNIGNVLSLQGQNDKAIESYQKTLEILNKTKDKNQIAKTYINIGTIYNDEGDLDKAIEYYNKAIEYLLQLNNENTLGIVYINTGLVYLKKSDLEKASSFSEKALTIFKKNGNKNALSFVYDVLAGINYDQHDFNKANKYAFSSLAIAEEVGDRKGLSYKLVSIAQNYNELAQYKKAILYANKGLQQAKELASLKEQIDAYGQLTKSYEGLNNYKEAYKNKLLETAAKDSLFTIEKTEKINEIQTKYETEKKDFEIAKKALEIDSLEKEAQKNKIFMLASAVILGLGILALVLFYRNRLTKEKYKAEMFNQKLLRSQMNPHFIFNTLTSIQSYMFEKDTLKAAMYLSSFSKLTRSILEGSRHDFVSLQEDYETNENYLKIQQMRYDSLFDYSISIDENIDPDHVQIAPMLIQPFIENSVKHGFKDIDYKGHLEIVYKKLKDKIEITIKDNGKGVIDSKEHSHKSHALSITKERLSILNKRNKENITFSIEQPKDKGYKVVFNVPLKVA